MFPKMLTLGSLGLLLAVGSDRTLAQRGMGDAEGVARQAASQPENKPQIVKLDGTLEAITIAPCERTTGRAQSGVHLRVLSDAGEQLNVHVGPKVDVVALVNQLSLGDEVVVDAFRTDKMATSEFVAVSVKSGDLTLDLRDESLRPYWAGGSQQRAFAGRGGGWGAGRNRSGRGFGCGRGPCMRYGANNDRSIAPTDDDYGRSERPAGFGRGGGRGQGFGAFGRGYGRRGQGPGRRGPGYAAGNAGW